MDEGAVGEIVFVDVGLKDFSPENSGLWIKILLSEIRIPTATVVIGLPGAVSIYDTITINSVLVNLTNPNDQQTIINDINTANVPDLLAEITSDAIQLNAVHGSAITVSQNSLGLYSIDAVGDLNTTGSWVPLQILGRHYTNGAAQIFIELPEEKIYRVLTSAVFDFTITTIEAQTSIGSTDITLVINGVSAPDFLHIPVSTIPTTIYGTQPVLIGNRIEIWTTNNMAASDLSIMIAYRN